MWRSVSVLLVVGAIASSSLLGADKRETPAETQARDLVKQALVSESQGDNDQRSKYLKEAWLSVPDLAEANWHMARIRVGEQWQPLAEAVSAATQSPDEATYRQLRDKANSPRQLRELARWCDRRGWNDRAELHYALLLADPKAEVAFKSEAVEKLKLVKVSGQWFTREEVEGREEQQRALQKSLDDWRPRLKKLQLVIDGPDFAKRDNAIKELAKLEDPTMIPALESFLLDGGADFQEQAVKRLATFAQSEATEALARYSILSDAVIVREEAAKALKPRPIHDYVPILLAGLASPIKTRFQLAVDRRGNVGYCHVLFKEDSNENFLYISNRAAAPRRTISVMRYNDPEIKGSFKTRSSESVQQRSAEVLSEARSEADAIELTARHINAETTKNNRRIIDALEETTGAAKGEEPTKWWQWWQDYNDYHWPKPTKYVYQYGRSYYPVRTYMSTMNMSCFLAGTPVRTERGAVPIESIQPGDRVLAQDQDTGELTYKVVLKTTLRPPAKMLRIAAGNDEVVTTLGHPFWVSGHGWKMAKELKTGDLLHTLGGAVKIESVAPAGEERAHNLVVDDFNTYFVGQAGCLVHDNQFRKPTQATVPGLVQ